MFAAQEVPPEALERFPVGVEVFGWTLPVVAGVAAVVASAAVFLTLAVRSLGRPH